MNKKLINNKMNGAKLIKDWIFHGRLAPMTYMVIPSIIKAIESGEYKEEYERALKKFNPKGYEEYKKTGKIDSYYKFKEKIIKKNPHEILSQIAKKTIKRRRYNGLAVEQLLKEWIKEKGKRDICPICGEDMPETFQIHHVDGNNKNNIHSNLIKICASCHNITFKADTRLKELWTKRHNNIKKEKVKKYCEDEP
ncbi:MAG: HNH endonuclease [Nanoarchaeota archaeon]